MPRTPLILLLGLVLEVAFTLIFSDWRFTLLVGLILGFFYDKYRKSALIAFLVSLIFITLIYAFTLFSRQNMKLLEIFSSIVGIPSIALLSLFIILYVVLTILASLVSTSIRKIIK